MRNITRFIVGVTALFFVVAGPAQAFAADVVDHSTFSSLLGKYVDDDGDVAYEKLKENDGDMKTLKSYLGKVAEADPSGHGEDAQLAFYLNAYNATVIASIINHWPTDSPQSVDGFFKKEKHKIAGKKMTLDTLEHGLIREKFDEARIHFVLVCAAKSCPRLRQKALTGDNLESMLRSSTKEFVPNATEVKGGKVVTSKLFKWFASDFKEAEGSVREYLAKYTSGDVKKALTDKDAKITYSDYDWTVNAQ